MVNAFGAFPAGEYIRRGAITDRVIRIPIMVFIALFHILMDLQHY